MSKLYFLAPSAEVAKQIVDELHLAGVGDDDIGVLARSEAVERALPSADVTDTRDVAGIRRWIAVVWCVVPSTGVRTDRHRYGVSRSGNASFVG